MNDERGIPSYSVVMPVSERIVWRNVSFHMVSDHCHSEDEDIVNDKRFEILQLLIIEFMVHKQELLQTIRSFTGITTEYDGVELLLMRETAKRIYINFEWMHSNKCNVREHSTCSWDNRNNMNV